MSYNCNHLQGDLACTEYLVLWNSLECRPRSAKFDRALKAEVRDSFWMLSRQWQMGEFKGDDGGSIIFSKFSMNSTKLTRYAPPGGEALPFDETLPLETRVEREDIRVDLKLRAQMGKQWLKIIRQHLGGLTNTQKLAFISTYGFSIPAFPDDTQTSYPEDLVAYGIQATDTEAWQALCSLAGRAMDGYSYLQAIDSGDYLTDGIIPVPNHSDLTAAANEFVQWFNSLYNQPDVAHQDSAWKPENLEYQFACSAPHPDQGSPALVMKADEYYQGRLDWYSVDYAESGFTLTDKQGETFNDNVLFAEVTSVIPSKITFKGMPHPRWWQMEDHQVDFGGIEVNTTDFSKLLIMDFALNASSDWHSIPYTLEVGSLMDVEAIEVRDCFGVRTYVEHANNNSPSSWQTWNLFTQATRLAPGIYDQRLFLPPVVAKNIESDDLEKVNFIRDEMANMVWGIEEVIPTDWGYKGRDGHESSIKLTDFLTEHAPLSVSSTPLDNDALLKYKLATTVPENWIPFIPNHVDGSWRSIRLQRGAMPRDIEGLTTPVVEPRTDLLRVNLDNTVTHYYLNEEEVPKAGAIVKRTFQRSRWQGGKVYLWQGRQKKTGIGTGASGLRFDQLESKEEEES